MPEKPMEGQASLAESAVPGMNRALPDTVPVITLLALYIVLAVLLVANGLGEPLTRIHGDGPIHLYQAKRLAETPLARSYIRHAGEVAEQVDGRWPTHQDVARY